jgi:ATP-dependent Zn protease
MDGFGTNTNVIVLANRADVLDKALMRAVVLIGKFLLTYQTLEKELKSLKCTLRLLKK